VVGVFRYTNFFSTRYHSGMDAENRELWDRLENEPERAYRAFESYLGLPSGERTVVEAYRSHVGNPAATKISDTWAKWSSDYAWRLRASAYDDHLANLRREAYERAIREEAERQGREAEKTRGRMNELMTLGYERAMECLEDEDWVSRNLRSSDVLNITRLHLDAVKALEVDREPKDEGDWTEEDDAEIDQIIKEVDTLTDLERPEVEEENPEEDSDEEGENPEKGEDGQG
jgi:hypothetical protein